MKYHFLSIALAAVSFVASQSGSAEAGFGCKTYHRYSYQPVTVVQPVVQQTVVQQSVVPPPVVVQAAPTPTVVVAVPAPTPAPIVLAPRGIKIPQGGTLRLKANFLGKEPGQVFLATGPVTFECEVIEWNPSFVVIHLPEMAVVKETAGKIVIATNEGALKRKVEVIVVPTPDVEVVASDEFIRKAPTEVLGN